MPIAGFIASLRSLGRLLTAAMDRGGAEAARNHIKLGRARPTRTRARDYDEFEIAPKAFDEIFKPRAHEDLCDHCAAQPERRGGEVERRINQLFHPRLIAIRDPAELRREIARHEVGASAQCRDDPGAYGGFADVTNDDFYFAGRRAALNQINADYFSTRPNRARQYREPSARRTSQIDHSGAGAGQVISVEQFFDLERCARWQPLFAGLLKKTIARPIRRHRDQHSASRFIFARSRRAGILFLLVVRRCLHSTSTSLIPSNATRSPRPTVRS